MMIRLTTDDNNPIYVNPNKIKTIQPLDEGSVINQNFWVKEKPEEIVSRIKRYGRKSDL